MIYVAAARLAPFAVASSRLGNENCIFRVGATGLPVTGEAVVIATQGDIQTGSETADGTRSLSWSWCGVSVFEPLNDCLQSGQAN